MVSVLIKINKEKMNKFRAFERAHVIFRKHLDFMFMPVLRRHRPKTIIALDKAMKAEGHEEQWRHWESKTVNDFSTIEEYKVWDDISIGEFMLYAKTLIIMDFMKGMHNEELVASKFKELGWVEVDIYGKDAEKWEKRGIDLFLVKNKKKLYLSIKSKGWLNAPYYKHMRLIGKMALNEINYLAIYDDTTHTIEMLSIKNYGKRLRSASWYIK